MSWLAVRQMAHSIGRCVRGLLQLSEDRRGILRLMSQKRLREPPGKSSRDYLLEVLSQNDSCAKRLLSLEALEARCGSRLRQVRRAETCLGTFDVVRVAQSEFHLVVAPEVARRWLAVCGSAAPSATGRILNET